MIKQVGIVAGGIAGLVLLAAALNFFDLAWFKFWAPKYESVKRQVFEETKSYNDAMVQELQAMQLEYVKASPEHKAAIASIVLHRVASYPNPERLPQSLYAFITELKQKQGIN